MQSLDERAIRALVIANLGLQVFDGLATYTGLHAGLGEGNPLLAWTLGHLGAGSALLLFKVQACACLLLLWRMRASRCVVPALAFCAAVYLTCSLAPWTVALAAVHLDRYIAS